MDGLDALGVLESFSVAALIEGADAAVKSAYVQLIEMRLAMALGGKAFVTMTGSVAAVRSAVDAGAQVVGQKGMLVNKAVIPSPRPELMTDSSERRHTPVCSVRFHTATNVRFGSVSFQWYTLGATVLSLVKRSSDLPAISNHIGVASCLI